MSWYLYMKALEIIMKRKFKQRCSTIPLISEKRRINPLSPQIIAHDIYQWNYYLKRNKDCLALAHVFTPVYLVRSVLLIFIIFRVVFFVSFVFILCLVRNAAYAHSWLFRRVHLMFIYLMSIVHDNYHFEWQ